MNPNKIAVLIDSCTDVPSDIIQEKNMFVAPLKIIYPDKEYYDGIDISAREVYQRMPQEIPKTSLPNGEMVMAVFEDIVAQGYEKVIAITISSAMSGTSNLLTLIGSQFNTLEVCVIDSKNIAIAAGFHAIQAMDYIEQGLSFAEVCSKIKAGLHQSKLFFTVSTLDYMAKGGRIGLVAGLIGNALHLKPIVTCNEAGVCYSLRNVRGRKQSLTKTLEIAKEFVGEHTSYRVAVAGALVGEEAEELKQRAKELFPDCVQMIDAQVSPAIGVHSGPSAIGIGIQIIE